MLDVVADLHLHSKYSRAVSSRMTLSHMVEVAKQKGLGLLATGDWTHPLWFEEIRSELVESEEGIYRLKKQLTKTNQQENEVKFLLSVEIATIFRQAGKGRRVHNLIFVPSFETASKVNKELVKRGANLSADGRPMIGLSSRALLELILEVDERSLLIPAHVWTPWFGIYGHLSGFESLTEAFGDLEPFIYGIETGLSSDPQMNWQMEELTHRSILSFSDAHSLPKMGREATVFQLKTLSYENIREAIMAPSLKIKNRKFNIDIEGGRLRNGPSLILQNQSSIIDLQLSNRVSYTIEFYPEEGKYHHSGHRNCNVVMTPEQQRVAGGICPVCKRKVTDGVMRRVLELSSQNPRETVKTDEHDIVWIEDRHHVHPKFVKLVPLIEIIAEAISSSLISVKAKKLFETLCSHLQSELYILLKAHITQIEETALLATSAQNAKRIAEGIRKVREASIVITPGYDGVYGVVKIWPEGEDVAKDIDETGNETKAQLEIKF